MSDNSSDEIRTDNLGIPEIPEEHEEKSEGLRDFILAVIFCLSSVLIVRSFLVEPFRIPSSSMVPTLKIGDHIFVSKFPFGLFVPFTKYEFLRTGTPNRGDVVVFLFPKDESLHYIKRVIGLPGDKLQFQGKNLFINGELVSKEKVSDPNEIEKVTGSREAVGELYKEKLGDKVHYVRYLSGPGGDFGRSSEVVEVPPDSFFMAGDNRDDSYDSRSWGPVPRHNLKGRAEIIWLSLASETGSKEKVRWDRMLSVIH